MPHPIDKDLSSRSERRARTSTITPSSERASVPACARHAVHTLGTAQSRPHKRINRNKRKAQHWHNKSARQVGHVGNCSHHLWQYCPAHDGHDKKGGCLFCPLPEAKNTQRKNGREHDRHKKIGR